MHTAHFTKTVCASPEVQGHLGPESQVTASSDDLDLSLDTELHAQQDIASIGRKHTLSNFIKTSFKYVRVKD